mgnify:CR=1 FL=1
MDIEITDVDGSRARLRYGALEFDCALGKNGITSTKREGDHATPAGRFPLRQLYYRPDKFAKPPKCVLSTQEMDMLDGWCDAPEHELYNQYVRLPFGAGHEQLWRTDEVFILVFMIGNNDDPVVPGAGSCIFMHVARENYAPTEGCVALAQEDLLTLLAAIETSTEIVIPAP